LRRYNKETGKAPGLLQVAVFALSQLFVGVVMQPLAVVINDFWAPYIAK
jgi:hypothetical protein